MSKKECDICCEVLNKSTKKAIKCSYDECGAECCVVCFNRHLLNSTLNPTCMFCNKDLSMDFIWEVSSQKFYNSYIDYRTLIIIVREKSLIPASQHLAENILNERKLTILIEDIKEDISDLNSKFFKIKYSLNDICLEMDLKFKIKKLKYELSFDIKNMTWIDYMHTTRCDVCDACHDNINYDYKYFTCISCNFNTCNMCFRLCLTQKKSCIICDEKILDKEIIDKVPKSFYDKYLKDKKITKKTKIINVKNDKIVELINEKIEANNKVSELAMKIYKYKNKNSEDIKKEDDKKFVKACPGNDCRGFLSSAYKCGICEKFFCPDCEVEKASRNDEDHVCNEDLKATVAMLKKNTRPCPKCSTPIEKSEGCFAENTKIPLYNGEYKMSQDINISDVLIGDDGEPRIVKALLRGIDEMYKIYQNGGIDYTVNSQHKLVLKCKDNKIHEICVEEYIKSNLNLFGYKSNDSKLINIDVHPVGKNKYYGWEVDKNHRFVLSDFTVVRNCDQMYCVVPNCKTAFSWNTGKIDKGVIHNPEYYRQQRELNNGHIPRNAGDNPCGGIPEFHEVSRKFKEYNIPGVFWHRFHRLINHVRFALITDLPTDIGNINNEELRVKYIIGDIDEELWKKKLKMKIKKAEREFNVYQILDMYIHASTDIFRNFMDSGEYEIFTDNSVKLIKYTDEQIIRVNKRYKSRESKFFLERLIRY